MHDLSDQQAVNSGEISLIVQTIHDYKQAHPQAEFHLDSRLVRPGDAFIAMPGSRVNGYDYINDALQNGAGLILAEKAYDHPSCMVCLDLGTQLAGIAQKIHGLAKYVTIAITGSVGKTTTRHILTHVLGQVGRVSATSKNHNNELGVPLTILSADPFADYLVLEYGAAKEGDIEYLMNIAMPDVGVCLPISGVHLANYSGMASLIATKEKIYTKLTSSGVAVINLDQTEAQRFLQNTAARVATFSQKQNADVLLIGADYQPEYSRYRVQVSQQIIDFECALPGAHLSVNVLSVLTVVHGLGIDLDVMQSLAKIDGVAGRMQFIRLGEHCLINDAYNASPKSTEAAVDHLAQLRGRKVLIFGDMGELGDAAVDLHCQIGSHASHKIDELITIGDLSRYAGQHFEGASTHYASHDRFFAKWQLPKSPVHILVKGSRFMQMDLVCDWLISKVEEQDVK